MAPFDRFTESYSADRFRALGHRIVDRLADYLAEVSSERSPMEVLPRRTPDEALSRWPGAFDDGKADDLESLLTRVIAESNHLHHRRYVGHQVTAPLPDAALCELVGAFLNNSMAVYEMGPASTAMERAVIAWMAAQLGFPTTADGVLTSGGSIGNLTALLAARASKGAGRAPQSLAVIACEQAHYSVRRAVEIMGLGSEGAIAVPADERFRMRVDLLDDAHRVAKARGREAIAVVGSACSTATGAVDDLRAIGDHAAARGLFFHVDGAHGASAILAPAHRSLLDGVERADSIVWDAHKMMTMPSLVTAVIFRDGDRSYDAFAQEASYLFEGNRPRDEWFNLATRTLECTKRMMALPIYAALAVHGPSYFAEYVARTFERARVFAERLRREPDFELAVEPQCNIVCFRHRPEGVADVDGLQRTIRKRIVDSGAFYLVQTGLPRGVFLRVTIINPLTTDDDLAALIDAVRGAASSASADSGR